MGQRLILILASASLAACQQQTASEPNAAESAAAATPPSNSPAEGPAAAATDAPPAAAAADAAGSATGDGSAKPASGYDWAEAHHIDDANDCTVGDEDFRDGCRLYVNEKAIDEGESEFEGDGE